MAIFLFSGKSSFTKSVLLLGLCPEHLVFLAAITLLLNLEHLKSLCSSHYLISKNYFQYFKSFSSIFPSPLKQNFMKTQCSLKSAIFDKCENHTWNNTPKSLIRLYLTTIHAIALFQAGSDSADIYT